MGDTLQDAINALRSAGLSREADAVEELRARHNSTMETFHAAQRASYWSGVKIGRAMTATPPAQPADSNSPEFDGISAAPTTQQE